MGLQSPTTPKGVHKMIQIDYNTEVNKMKRLITIALVIISLIIGYVAGANTASKDIADVTASDAGV